MKMGESDSFSTNKNKSYCRTGSVILRACVLAFTFGREERALNKVEMRTGSPASSP